MLGTQHIQFGIVTGAAAGAVMLSTGSVSLPVVAGFAALSVFGALVPDADHEHSTINSKLKVTKVIHYIFGQRNLFHDPVFWGIVAAVMAYYSVPLVWFGILFGIAGHLFLDAFTVWGIPFLSIIRRKGKDGKSHERYTIHLLPKGKRVMSESKVAVALTWVLNILVVLGTFSYMHFVVA